MDLKELVSLSRDPGWGRCRVGGSPWGVGGETKVMMNRGEEGREDKEGWGSRGYDLRLGF